jgi:hypothetical protein
MTTKTFNFTFEDGCEYEATVYGGGGVKIRAESGKVVFENGSFTTRDIMEILTALKDEIESKDPNYQNWIEETEEVERMEMSESEIRDAMAKTIVDFVDDNLADWADDEKLNMRRFLTAFCHDLEMKLTDAETAKLDKMAEAGQ